MQKRHAVRALKCLATFSLIAELSGCAATQVALSKKNLVVQTKMSESIFLDPVEPDQQTIYVRVRNTSGEGFKVGGYLRSALEGADFELTKSPAKARFQLDVNVLSLELASLDAAEAARNAGFGAGGVGATMGALIGGNKSGWQGAATGGLAGGLAGAGLEMVSGSLVKDITYMLVTDIQLVEKAPSGAFVRTDIQIDSKKGDGGRATQTLSTVTDSIKYQTRIVSTANKVNLKKEEAIPPMAEGIAKSIAGLFGGESI